MTSGSGSVALEEALDAGTAAPAQVESGAIPEDDGPVAVGVGSDLTDAVDVDDDGAVDAQEALRVQPMMDPVQGPAHPVDLAYGVDADVVAR